MDRKNKGKEVFDKFSDAVRVLLVDDDNSCHLELARMLQQCGCDVTKCNGVKDALDWLRKDTSGFDIMIADSNLLDLELLQKVVREMDLLVIAMPQNGTSKPIPMDILVALWQYVFRKRTRNPAEVRPTIDVPKAKKPRFHWPPKYHKIFTDCLEELKKEGIKPTPKNIMEPMEAKGVRGLTIAIVKSHKQKWEKKLKKEVPQSDMQGSINASTNLLANNPQNQDLDETMLDSFDDPDFYLDFSNEDTLPSFFDEHEDGPSSVHVLESLNSAAAMNISSQHHIGAPQIMTQSSSSRQICNDLPGGLAFDDGTSINASTNLLANNPQNQDLDEIMLPPFDDLDVYCNLCNNDTISDIDLWDN